MVEYLVSFMYIITMHATKTTSMTTNKAKAPSAHLATNQKREAKQKFGARIKKATRPVATSRIFMTTKHITASHFPLEGKGFVLRPRMATSSPNISCMYGTIKIAGMY